MIRTTLLAMLVAAAPAGDAPFDFTPVPRWQEEPETGDFCIVAKAECPAMFKDGTIEADVRYDELYDAKGMLVGLRLSKPTGCAALDEKALLSHRDFRLAFREDGEPDLDDIHAELAPGTDPGAVRIVKSSGTSISIGCN